MTRDAEDLVRAVAVGLEPGEVISYGEIARIVGLNPRHVGRIVSRIADDIPWWRVVHADGTPATCHEGQAAQLLRHEGVPFTGDRVTMSALPGDAHRAADSSGPSKLTPEGSDTTPREESHE